jgi:hypothetical protein
MHTIHKILLSCIIILAICAPVHGDLSDADKSGIEKGSTMAFMGKWVSDAAVEFDGSNNLVVHLALFYKPLTTYDVDHVEEIRGTRTNYWVKQVMDRYVQLCEQHPEVGNLELYIDGDYYTCPRSRVDSAIKNGADTSCINCGELSELVKDVQGGKA